MCGVIMHVHTHARAHMHTVCVRARACECMCACAWRKARGGARGSCTFAYSCAQICAHTRVCLCEFSFSDQPEEYIKLQHSMTRGQHNQVDPKQALMRTSSLVELLPTEQTPGHTTLEALREFESVLKEVKMDIF